MEPTHPPAGGAGSYLVSFAALDLGVLAYTAKPLVPVIELVFDSLAAPTDNPDIQPMPFVADNVYVSSQSTLTYPSTTSSAAATDQEANGVRKKVVDSATATDSVTTSLTTPPPAGWVDSGGSSWTLTNSNLTGSYQGVGGDTNLFANFTKPTTAGADYTYTVTVDAIPSGASIDIGVTASPATLGTGAAGGDNQSAGVFTTGDVYYSSFTVGGNVGRALVAGDVVHIRIKDGYAYWALNGGGWVGITAGANPAANTGGVPISGWGSTVTPVVYGNTPVGTQYTAAF